MSEIPQISWGLPLALHAFQSHGQALWLSHLVVNNNDLPEVDRIWDLQRYFHISVGIEILKMINIYFADAFHNSC